MLSRIRAKSENKPCCSACSPFTPSCFAGFSSSGERAKIKGICFRAKARGLIEKYDNFFAQPCEQKKGAPAPVLAPYAPCDFNLMLSPKEEKVCDRMVRSVGESLPQFSCNRCMWLPETSEVPACFDQIPAFDPQELSSLQKVVDVLNGFHERLAEEFQLYAKRAYKGKKYEGKKPEKICVVKPGEQKHCASFLGYLAEDAEVNLPEFFSQRQFLEFSHMKQLKKDARDIGDPYENWPSWLKMEALLKTFVTSNCFLVYSQRARRSGLVYSQHLTSCELSFIESTVQRHMHSKTETNVSLPYKPSLTEFENVVAKFSSASEQSMRRGINAHWVINNFTDEVKSRMPGRDNPNFQEMASTVAFGDTAIGAWTICPRDGKRGSSIVDALCDKGPSDGSFKFSNKATIFLSWVWRYRLQDAVSAIENYCQQRREKDTSFNYKDTYIWWCFFVNNQFRILGDGKTVPTEEFEKRFAAQLQSCPSMLIMLDSFSDPTYIKRIWCIYEVYVCAKVNKPIEITMPQESSVQLANALHDIHALSAKINIDAEAAEATIKSDEDFIKEKIEEEVSFAQINAMVKKALVDEIMNKVRTVLDSESCRALNCAEDGYFSFQSCLVL